MPAFSHSIVSGSDAALIEEIYQLGKANPIPEDYACSPYPHVLKADIQAAADDPGSTLLAVYDGGVLRSVVAYSNDGTTKFGFTKPYGDGKNIHPTGRQLMNYMYGVVKAQCGRARTVSNPNPGAKGFYQQLGIETE